MSDKYARQTDALILKMLQTLFIYSIVFSPIFIGYKMWNHPDEETRQSNQAIVTVLTIVTSPFWMAFWIVACGARK